MSHAATRQPARSTHPRRAAIHQQGSLGERIADHMAAAVGSWSFIIGQTLFIAAWIAANSAAFLFHWDPYPWILLNLCMSTQAMYTGPILLLAGNRQASKDRRRDDAEALEVDELFRINREQLEILRILHELQQANQKASTPDAG